MAGRGNKQEEFWAEVQRVVMSIRPKLRRAIAFLNGKGGTGKTSSCANIAATLANIMAKAQSTRRVLVMEFDVQGNLKADLGIKGTAEDDDGQSMLTAVMGTGGLVVVRDVRPNLDLVPSGEALKRVVRFLASSSDKERIEAWLSFAQAVAAIADEYDYIFLDCPPGDEELQKLAMVLGQWIIIPTVFDKASRWGLELVGKLFDAVDGVNEEVDVLGVLMFGFERREERLIKDKETGAVVEIKEVGQRLRLRRALEADLARGESDAPVFAAVIGSSKAVAEVCRQLGRVAYEVADLVASDEWPTTSKTLAKQLAGKVSITQPTVEALATDYENAAIEIASRIRKLEGAAA